MLPALRLPLLTLGLLLISTSAAQAGGPSIPVPAEGQVAVTFASGVKSVKVKSAPAGVTIAGGVKQGKLAVAVVRPRGVAAKGKVVLTVKGKAKGVKTIAAALNGGKAPNCRDLAGLLRKRLKGSVDVKGLAGVLAAKLCGKAAPANAAEVLRTLGLGAPPVPPAPPAQPAGGKPTPPSGGGIARPNPTATATPTATPGNGKPACGNGADDDKDGQVDGDDPGCADANDATENSEVPVSQDCLDNHSGVSMGDESTSLFAAINGCGPFTKARLDVAPGIAECTAITGGQDWDCKPAGGTYALATAKDGKAIDTMDVLLTLTGGVRCDRNATIALYRPNGEVAEIHKPVGNCGLLKPACSNGKDDDGDGMIDDHFADGATDPDPGCTGTTDTTENSEVAAPESCKIALGLWDDTGKVAGATAKDCGGIQGFWYHAPGTVTECAYRLGGDPAEDCQVVGETGGTMFAKTTQSLSLAVALTAEADCRAMTLALIKDTGAVWFFRAKLGGC